MSSKRVECETHGDCLAAYVCSHTRTSLRDGQPRGFFWSRDTDGCINAWCQDCDDVLESAGGDWNDESEAFANIVLVCEGCAKRVAKINGLEVLD